MGIIHNITRILEKIGAYMHLPFNRVHFVEQVVKPFGKYRFAMLLVLTGAFQMACTITTKENTDSNTGNVEKTEITAPIAQTTKQIVEIKGMKFNPTITLSSIGDTVLFINKDLVPHNVTDRENNDTLSSQIDPSKEWMLIVSKNLHYYCSLHPNMEGEIKLSTP